VPHVTTSSLKSKNRDRRERTSSSASAKVRKVVKENGLSLVLGGLFFATWVGQAAFGFAEYNESRSEHGFAPVAFSDYLTSGHLLEATFENWESEFFQMGLFVILTVRLFQRGSSESKSLDEPNECDSDPAGHRRDPEAPWPVRRGGLLLKLYEHSLSVSLLLLFLASFVLHAFTGLKNVNEEHALEGLPKETLGEYVASPRFWFESFQNWQSEFLAVLAIVVLSIFLREKGSAQSKAVAAPHSETG
jgi:hypothetical protein